MIKVTKNIIFIWPKSTLIYTVHQILILVSKLLYSSNRSIFYIDIDSIYDIFHNLSHSINKKLGGHQIQNMLAENALRNT